MTDLPEKLDLADFPDRPQAAPLDWGQVARAFDRFVMDPANRVLFHSPGGETVFTAFLDDLRFHTDYHELTTFGPIVLGKALLGQDVRGMARSLRMFYDEQQRVFLNTPGQPHVEWWYLMNINALAAHLVRTVLADDAECTGWWRSAADRLMALARRVSYDFNQQGYDFSKESAWTDKDIFRQPDTIAAYSYLMLLAHATFHSPVYLEEARTAMARYLALTSNPWYEIPSGAMGAAAAHLSALGDAVDVERAVRLALDPRAALVQGTWGGQEVNGLVRGWRYSQPESAYSMESLVLLPYLLPVARRVPTLARLIGNYALHAAANARLFYSAHTPYESRPDLDPSVAYERLYQTYQGRSPYAAGDFAGHKSVYGGAYALWWGALVQATADPYILRLDLVKSDFLTPDAHPTSLIYNPYPETRSVALPLPEAAQAARGWDIYDLEQHRVTQQGASAAVDLALPPDSARVIVLLPASAPRELDGAKLVVDGRVVDWGLG